MFIRTVPEDEATGAVADYYDQQRRQWGFLPDYAGAFAPRPAVAEGWAALNGAIRGGMDRRRFELVTIAAARARRSTYCTAAHSKFLRDDCGDVGTLDALTADPSGAGLAPVDRALYAFATKVATAADTVDGDDVAALRAHGLGDAEIAEVVYAVAARAFFTTVLDGLGAQLDPQTAAAFPDETLAGLIVGRPVGGEAS